MSAETEKLKKECTAKAQTIVESMIDGVVKEEYFLKQVWFINQCHLDDIIEERALQKLCGYPLCGNRLSDVTKQKYHINTRVNKVYNITERKLFCSNKCYNASCFIKEQMFTSPLWLRNVEGSRSFQILKSANQTSCGQEIDLGSFNRDNLKEKINDSDIEINEASSSNIEQEILVENLPFLSHFTSETEEEIVQEVSKGKSLPPQSSAQINEVAECRTREKETDIKSVTQVQLDFTKKVPQLNDSAKLKSTPPKRQTEHLCSNELSNHVLNCVNEWFTIEALIYLVGDEKVNEDTGKIENIESIKTRIVNKRNSEKIFNLCKKLNFLVFNDAVDESVPELKPLPDYSVVKKDSQELEVKVRAFYKGMFDVVNKAPSNTETTKTEDVKFRLPVVDSHAQNTLRRKILTDLLTKLVPDVLRILGVTYIVHVKDIRELVLNFDLAAHNITFKPAEWNILALIVIKLFSLKSKKLFGQLYSEKSKNVLVQLLELYELPASDFEDFIQKLINAKRLLEKIAD